MAPLTLGRIVVPQTQIARVGKAKGPALESRIDDPGKDARIILKELDLASLPWTQQIHQRSRAGLEMYLATLFTYSSYKVIIASPSEASFTECTEGLPDIVAERVEFADPEHANVYRLTKSFFLPIAKDLESSRKSIDPKELLRRVGNSRRVGNPVTLLAGEIYLLLVAAVHSAQVDWNAEHVRGLIARAREATRTSESKLRLSMIEGIINMYRPEEIGGLRLVADVTDPSVKRRLLDLFRDSMYQDLAHERYQLGRRASYDVYWKSTDVTRAAM
jgi:hypothetical protein